MKRRSPGLLSRAGPLGRRLTRILRRRGRGGPRLHPSLEVERHPALFRKQAVLFTDTDDFTVRVARDGILHFLALFDEMVEAVVPVVEGAGGVLVKVEADSMLLRFDDAAAACRGVDAIERRLARLNRRLPSDEHLAFSYGIGYGDVLVVEDDVFGLEVNLASKLGEDLARPGQALLTPAAAAALPTPLLRRVSPFRVVTFARRALPVQRLALGGSGRRRSR